MKKFLAKIVLFSIVSLMLTTLASPVTMAEVTYYDIEGPVVPETTPTAETTTTPTIGTTQTDTKLDELEKLGDLLDDETKCIDETGPDKGYIITIIEEPLSFEPEGKPGDDYQSRTCVRNYFSFTGSDGEETSVVELLKDCSSKIKNNNYSSDDVKKYNIKYSCQTVQVLLSKGGLSLIEGYIGTFYKWAAGIVGIIAVLVIILSGIQISAAGGDTQAIENAKNRITKSIAGIVVLFLSGLILYTINPTFFVK